MSATIVEDLCRQLIRTVRESRKHRFAAHNGLHNTRCTSCEMRHNTEVDLVRMIEQAVVRKNG